MAISAAELIPLLPAEELARRQRRAESAWPELWDLLDQVMDPEIPVITLFELGVLQDVQCHAGRVSLLLTPTYVGCPALAIMEEDARAALAQAGYDDVDVEITLSPAWTTAWLTSEARQKMAGYGVAAPENDAVICPQCGSGDVVTISEFGSTACKALYRCRACAEPFDVFKAL